MAALNRRRARILMAGLIAAGTLFTVLVLALDEDGRPGFRAGLRLPDETAAGASWSPDGRWIAIPNREGVLLRGAEGGDARQLAAPRLPRYRGRIPGRIGWSGDGKRLRYVTTDGPEAGNGAWVTEVPVAGGTVRQVTLGAEVRDAGWSPRGWHLVYVPEPPGGLWSLTAFDAKPKRLLDLPGEESRPQVSPDGKRVLFARTRTGKGVELWIAHADGTASRRLAGPFQHLDYSWAPNSRRVALIAAASRSVGSSRLSVLAARNGAPRSVPVPQGLLGSPAWTPGGRWITYARDDGRIEKVRAGGGEPVQLAHFPGERVRNLLWSPSAKKLAYSSLEVPDESP